MNGIFLPLPGWQAYRQELRSVRLDMTLLLPCLAIMALGLVMVGSASITQADRTLGQPFYYVIRQASFLLLGLGMAVTLFNLRMAWLARAGMPALFIALGLLILVLIPGLGKTVNGSARWISLGVMNLQVSEPAKLLILIYLASYLVRRAEEVRGHFSGFLKPMSVLGLVSILLLAEPDFGATVVLMSTVLVMMYMAGVRLWQFLLLGMLALSVFALLAVSSPYRLARLTTFLNPWADPFNSGFQLTQSLIAIGRGEIWGVGLGGSVQKLFYLPEAHTDFVFAVTAEELGLVGVTLVVSLYAWVVYRAFRIGHVAAQAEEMFSAYLAYGIGTWIGLQSLINIGVNMGLLPTKGLTLPMFSYGGSSLVVMCLCIALLLRIDHETRSSVHGRSRGVTRGSPRQGVRRGRRGRR